MLTGPQVILILKIAVISVTILFLTSLVALGRGNRKLHGRINLVFFGLTTAALLGLEVIARILNPQIFDYMDQDPSLKRALTTHLCFSLPAAAIMPIMLFTGYTHKRNLHLCLAVVFSVLWLGTVVTGVFFLPHHAP